MMNLEDKLKIIEALEFLGFKVDNRNNIYAFINDEGVIDLKNIKEANEVAKLIKDFYRLSGKQDLIEKNARENEMSDIFDHECD